MSKIYIEENVFNSSMIRISKAFDEFEKLYISFSGGKDSSVMTHLVLDEARRRGVKVGLLIIDLEAQYKDTITHIQDMVEEYSDIIDLHWVCAELMLRNAVSNYEPRWTCWDSNRKDDWVREMPSLASDLTNNENSFLLNKYNKIDKTMI